MAEITDWFQKSLDSLALAGKAERTREAYTRALRRLCEFHGNRRPESIAEAQLEAYFLHRKRHDRWSESTRRFSHCPIRFYFVKVLGRDWPLFNYLRARVEARLPAILSIEEVHRPSAARGTSVGWMALLGGYPA